MEYWLDRGTLQDWNDIYSRELVQQPPVDVLAAWYVGYEPPAESSSFEAAEVETELPEFED